jgi:hypothetical protein
VCAGDFFFGFTLGQRVGAVVRGVFEVPVVVEGGVERVAEFVADAGDGGVDACD